MNTVGIDVVDFHAHILPRADHGSNSLKTSLTQLELAKKQGVTRIIATPHFYPHAHTLTDFLQLREKSAAELIKNSTDMSVEVKVGAEVLLCPGMENFPFLDKLCFAGTNVLLLELPFSDFKEDYCVTVSRIIESGIDVILAHADRYSPKNIEALIDVGVSKLQLNAISLTGFFKDKVLYNWLDRNLVVALGSDIHGTDASYYKKFNKAKKSISQYLNFVKSSSDEIWNKTSNFKL